MKTSLTEQDILDKIVGEEYQHFNNKNTICVLTLQNGFQVEGWAGKVDPKDFNPKIGEQVSKKRAIDKLWLLEGYLLQETLYKLDYFNDNKLQTQ
jgi:hypothetical protein